MNGSVPQRPIEASIDMVTLDVIVTSLKAAQPLNPSLHRALDKAVTRVRSGCAWTLRDNTLEVQSESQPWHMHTCTIAGRVAWQVVGCGVVGWRVVWGWNL